MIHNLSRSAILFILTAFALLLVLLVLTVAPVEPASSRISAHSSPTVLPSTPTTTVPSTGAFLPFLSFGPQPEGQLAVWYPLTISFSGPQAAESDEDPNPFLDYRLDATFIGPSEQEYRVPGFFAGDGHGGGEGNVWQVRFRADEPGQWHYQTSFRHGSQVAISLQPQAGEPVSFDGASGTFTVAERLPDAPGFLKWGRLEYVGRHYLKFRDGPYWLKGGTNSPENFLGYRGFDNTVDQGGIVADFLHEYAPHVVDWRPGDPLFVGEESGYDSKGIIGALNYLASEHVNSIYFLPLNLGGDGQDTYPFISPAGTRFANTHYDISKLEQWRIVFEHAQRQGIALQLVLNERETPNREWLDGGRLGVERRLFYRELVARFGDLLALKWNLSEENLFDVADVQQFGDYLEALNWAAHPIAVHTLPDDETLYTALLTDTTFSGTSFQYSGWRASQLVSTWRSLSAGAGRPWVIDMDEHTPAGIGLTPETADALRKEILYDIYFSGGNVEWYAGYYELPLGGDLRLEDFRTRQPMWDYMWYARRFMEENLPFWEMRPADALLLGEEEDFGGGEVFALDGEIYAIYLPDAAAGNARLTIDGSYSVHWFNPRTGVFVGQPEVRQAGWQGLVLGLPPGNPENDWVVLLRSTDDR